MSSLLCLSVFPFGVGAVGVDLILSVPEFYYLLSNNRLKDAN